MEDIIEKILKEKSADATYNILVCFKPFLPGKKRVTADIKFEELVKKYKGKILKKDIWGKKFLAYKIKGHNEGYYIMYTARLNKDTMDKLKTQLNRNEDIFRYLITKVSKKEF